MGTYGYSWEYLEDERKGLTDQAIEPPQHYAPALRRSARPRKVLRAQNRTVWRRISGHSWRESMWLLVRQPRTARVGVSGR